MSQPELMTIPERTTWARIGRTKAYDQIASGELRALKAGPRTLIRRADGAAWLSSMATIQPEVPPHG
jgi:hypothetical protein